MKKLLIVLLCLFSIAVQATNENDSLKILLEKTTDKKERFEILTELISNHLYTDKSYSKKLLVEAENISNEIKEPKLKARVFLYQGRVYETEGNYKKALSYFIQSQKLFEKVNDQKGVGQTLNSMGIISWYSGDYDKAIEYFNEGYSINKKIGDKEGMSTAKVNTAIIYDEQGQYDKALKIYEEALQIFIELKDDWSIAACYNNMGLNHTATKKYKLANESFEKSLAINRKIKDQAGIATALNNIGYNLIQTNQFSEALPYLKESLEISKKENFRYDMKLALLNLSLCYNGLGKYKDAFEYHRQYSSIKDSILNSESKKSMQELETKYSTEKKTLEIKNLKTENKNKTLELERRQQEIELKELREAERATQTRINNIILVSIIALSLVVLGFFYWRYRQKQADNLILQSKNEEISQQKNIIEEKNKDITDSIQYAKTIQDSVLPDISLLEKYFSDSFVLFLPRDIVSGDFYWFTEIDHKLIFTVGDCTGHGVPGSLMSMMGINILHQIVREEKITDPSKILHRLDENIKKQFSKENKELQSNDGMDIAIVLFEKNKNRIEYASAMRPLYFISDGELMELKNDVFPIGGNYDEKIFKTREVEIKKGDQLVLSTDGFADQFGGPKNKKFLTKKLKLLIQDSSQLPLAHQKNQLFNEFEKWKGKNEQVDDVCILGVKI